MNRFYVVLLSFTLASCGGSIDAAMDAGPSSFDGETRADVPSDTLDASTTVCLPSRAVWNDTVRPKVEEHCGRCHGMSPDFGAPFTLLDYASITAGVEGMRIIDEMHVRLAEDSMPPVGAPRPSVEDRDLIAAWASCGETRVTNMGGSTRPPFVAPDEPPMGLRTIDVVADNTSVGPTVLDRYDEIDFTNLTTEDVFIRRFEAVVDASQVLHHLTLRRGDPANPGSMKYLYAWAPGTNAVEFPSGGIRLRPTDTLRLQLHYNNGAGLDGIVDSSGVRLYVDRPEGDEYIMFDPGPGADGFSIPARASATIESTCVVLEPVRAIASMPHMHEIGDTFDILHASRGSDSESILALSRWSFDSQVFYELPVDFERGDEITVRCSYQNPTGESVSAGAGTNDEMCFAFTYVTPPPVGGVVCRPGGLGSPCEVTVSPERGTPATEFEISWTSDGSSCTWALDGVDQGPVECGGIATTTFAPGEHVVTLNAMGPDGVHSCDATATVVGAAIPTCSATIMPAAGDTSTVFTTAWMSDGAMCTWDLDGIPQSEIACAGSVMGGFPEGSHTVTLHTMGTGGSTSCTSSPIFVRP